MREWSEKGIGGGFGDRIKADYPNYLLVESKQKVNSLEPCVHNVETHDVLSTGYFFAILKIGSF
jgi:hypothetical protein